MGGFLLVSFSVALDALRPWARDHLSTLTVIVVAALFTRRAAERAIPPAISRAVLRDATPQNRADLRKRADTLAAVLVGAARLTVLVVAGLLVLEELQARVFPVLAGLGIGGIAIGLGAQSIVKDAINGLLILTENQYGKGDMVSVAGVQGWVQEVNLRRTILRDLDGTLHSIPNSEIKISSNLTRGYSSVNLLISLAAGTDVERGIELINAAGAELAGDPAFAERVLEPPTVTRVEALSAASLDLRVTGRVAPGAQWEIGSVLRRRIARRFEQEGLKFGPSPPPPAAPPQPIAGATANPTNAQPPQPH